MEKPRLKYCRGTWLAACFLPILLISRSHAEDAPEVASAVPVYVRPEIPDSIRGTLRKFNAALSQDIDPDENAAVILVQVFGEGVFEPALRDASLAMMGIRSLGSTSPRFEYLEPYAKRAGPAGQDPREFALKLQADMERSLERGWTADEFPALAKYLEKNQAAFQAIVAASRKPHYYVPLLSSDTPPRLISASFLVEHRLPYLARCLTSRALLSYGGGDFDGAMQDLLACHRLATLLAHGSPLDVSNAKAQVIDSLPFFAERAILESGQLTGEQSRLLQLELQKLPPLPTAAYAADRGERAILHQEIELLQAEDATFEDYLEQELEQKDAAEESGREIPIQWKLAIARGDEVQDEVVQALKMKDRTLQSQRFQVLDDEQAAWQQKTDADEDHLAEKFQKDPAGASRWIGEDMARALRTNCWQRRFTDDRAFVRRKLIVLGLALVTFQRERHAFPESLQALRPEFVDEIPNDPYSQQPFFYARESEQRARLTCWGANQADDAGKTYNDDIILRLR
jgi:hypothetical protein